ncbi:hypothetical protein EST38_g14637 [Candolleomyces aberdarensis]|uniref:F-box domain-containing protein n=1 Tax=Candolleomyces aberdarensis TaxID=2316362 RepID=A0A4V1Q1D6_9AGAR|nr:hypothetical protein EST38_g14637 [Candolleomyces aberdarensis]
MDFPSGIEDFSVHYVPSDEEIPAIRDMIRKGEEALKNIEWRMEELKRELRALEKRQEVQKRAVNKHKNLLAPIQRVNMDVLTPIFLSVLDDNDLEISANHPAVVISHVCQRWREVSLSTKLLWRHLHVQLPLYPWSSSERNTWTVKVVNLVQMTKLWISRSGNSHLNVKIVDVGNLSGGPVGNDAAFVAQSIEFHNLMGVICSSSMRWKDLCLFIGFPQARLPNFPTARLLTVPPQCIPALTTVKLHCDIVEFRQTNPLNEHMVSSTNIFSAPTLRSLRIGSRVMFHDLMRMPVAWSNLEHLFFDGYPTESPHRFDAAQALTLFEECKNLVTCHLALQRDVTIPTGRAPVPLQKLRELAFTPHTSQLPKGFAPFLILPSLRKLEVITGYGECTPREYEESGFSEFFGRFRPTLEGATFCYKSLTQTGLHDCLGDLPNVTSLGLVSDCRIITFANAGAANLNGDLFKHLSPEFDETGTAVTQLPLCPRIEAFKFGAFRGEVAEEALVDFIETRRQEIHNRSLQSGLARLREVDCDHYCFQATDPSQALRNRGTKMEAFSLTSWYHFP